MTPITPNSLAHMVAARWCEVAVSGVLTAGALTMLAGCSSSREGTPGSSSSSSSTSASASASSGASSGVSPGGVTTSVSAAAGLTEEQYYRACSAARDWMKAKSGEMRDQIEPYLAMVQSSPSGVPPFGTPWAQLTPEQQAGVIYAATSATDGGCPE